MTARTILRSLLLLAGAMLAGDPPLGLDLYRPAPDDNPPTTEKVAVGRRLFHDRLLSRDGQVSCATCHDPKRAFSDCRRVVEGVYGRTGKRNTPAILNRAWGRAFFWDGRAATLEAQVVEPIRGEAELGLTTTEAVARLRTKKGYEKAFLRAFGREINGDDVARAVASYVRTILAGGSPYDRHLAGRAGAITKEAEQGLRIFRGKGNCTACHAGPHLTDEEFHNTGVAWRDGQWQDDGRFAVTLKEEDRGAFKTPSLREVGRTAPYMHDGSLATLEDVIDYYDRGGNRSPGSGCRSAATATHRCGKETPARVSAEFERPGG